MLKLLPDHGKGEITLCGEDVVRSLKMDKINRKLKEGASQPDNFNEFNVAFPASGWS